MSSGPDLITTVWRKSSYSSGNGQCVEVAFRDDGTVAVRDSKQDAGPVMIVPGHEWQTFISGVNEGGLAPR